MGTMPSKTDLAYIAGLVDGEGYVGIKKMPPKKDRVSSGYHARIQVRMVDEPAIEFLSSTLGGSYYREKPHAKNGRPLYCYSASDAKAEHVLKRILPYLRIKRTNANAVLELRALQATGRKHRTKEVGHRFLQHWNGKLVRVRNLSFSDEYISQCEALYLRCKELNRVGATT